MSQKAIPSNAWRTKTTKLVRLSSHYKTNKSQIKQKSTFSLQLTPQQYEPTSPSPKKSIGLTLSKYLQNYSVQSYAGQSESPLYCFPYMQINEVDQDKYSETQESTKQNSKHYNKIEQIKIKHNRKQKLTPLKKQVQLLKQPSFSQSKLNQIMTVYGHFKKQKIHKAKRRDFLSTQFHVFH